MITVAEARALLINGVKPLAGERLAIGDARGRILGKDITAPRDQPPNRVSAMDGYAVRGEDAVIGATLRVIGDAPAGMPFARSVAPGEAVRIATGGVVPDGATRIVIQEHVARDGERITIRDTSSASFVRPAAGDFAAGAVVARVGELLTPARLALIAATGAGTVAVVRRPRVAILATGDELREPGDEAGPGAIFNSAAFAIAALVEEWGGEAVRHAILPDDRGALAARLAAADLDVDVIVPLGGASVGERDFLRPAFETMGARIAFDRVAVVPGKPSWHARFGDGRLVVGLPGNPASAFVCAHLFLSPLLLALTGRDPALRLSDARLVEALPANGAREAWLRGTVVADDDGQLHATIDSRQDSSLITPLAAANALIRRTVDAPGVTEGGRVEFFAIS